MVTETSTDQDDTATYPVKGETRGELNGSLSPTIIMEVVFATTHHLLEVRYFYETFTL